MTNPYTHWHHATLPRLLGRDEYLRQLLGDMSAPVKHAVQLVAVPGMGASTLLRYIADPAGLWKNHARRTYLAAHYRQPNRLLCVYVDMRLYTVGVPLTVWLCQTLSRDERLKPFLPAEAACDALPMLPLTDAITALERRDVRVALLLDHLDRPLCDLKRDEAAQLRPLAGQAVIVTVTEQPLMRLNAESAASWLGTSQRPLRLGLCERGEALDLLREPLPKPARAPTTDEAQRLLALTGLAPGLILRGAAEWWAVRERYAHALTTADLFDFLRARLREAFLPNFRRYWQSLNSTERQALEWTVRDKHTLPPSLTASADDLWQMGLLQRNPQTNAFKPFSELWQAYIEERLAESQAEAELRPAAPVVGRGTGFTSRDAALLAFLRARPHQVLTYAEIVRGVWHLNDPEHGLDALRMAVKRLRATLTAENAPEEIINHRGRGYEYRHTG